MVSSARSSDAFGSCISLNSARSAPAQNPGPAPVSTTQRTLSSPSAVRSASSSALVSAAFIALRFDGRLSVRTRIGPRSSIRRSVIEERRLALNSLTHIEIVNGPLLLCDEQFATVGGNGVQHRVGHEIEEHHRLELAHQARVQDQQVDVRCATFVSAGLHGAKAVDTVGVGGGAPLAEEIGIVEATAAVGLPELEHDVIQRPAVDLRDATGDLDDLTRRAHGQVARGLRELARKERPE